MSRVSLLLVSSTRGHAIRCRTWIILNHKAYNHHQRTTPDTSSCLVYPIAGTSPGIRITFSYGFGPYDEHLAHLFGSRQLNDALLS